MPLKNYNFKDGNVLIIGTEFVGGFAEDGGVEYDMAADRYEDVNGADGVTTISQMNDNRMYADITLMETSKSYRVLANFQKVQEAQLIKLPLPYIHRDQINGDTISEGTCVFMTKPTPSKGRTAGERVFRLLLPDGAGNGLLLGSQNFLPDS